MVADDVAMVSVHTYVAYDKKCGGQECGKDRYCSMLKCGTKNVSR